MRYLVKAKLKARKTVQFLNAVDRGTLGRGSIAGDQYLHDMEMARVNDKGEAHWVETCFCDPPLEEERPYWASCSIIRSRAGLGVKRVKERRIYIS